MGTPSDTKRSKLPCVQCGRIVVRENLQDDEMKLQVVEERPVIRRRKKIVGGVRVRTVLHENEETARELLSSEDVEVEHVPVGQLVEKPASIRQEGDTIILPVHEEVLVVEKRLKLVEEVHITKRRKTEVVEERVTLRRAEAVVEHFEADQDNKRR